MRCTEKSSGQKLNVAKWKINELEYEDTSKRLDRREYIEQKAILMGQEWECVCGGGGAL